MLTCNTYERTHLRELASLISNASFKRLTESSNQSAYIRKMKKYIGWHQITSNRPKQLVDLIALSYQVLEENYRHEYIYKNKLFKDYVLEYYALDDTILLNEFRIGQSIADSVLVNGTNKVFEIKTELDTPERLQSQLQDYYRAFTEVYVFTHSTLLDRYLRLLPPYVGIILYTEQGQIETYRSASARTASLDPSFMMGSLRKAEYTSLVKQLTGGVPKATPAFFYRTCLEVLYQFSVEEVQRVYCSILKQRIDKQKNVFLSEGSVPQFMNYSFYQSKLDKSSYLTLINNLRKNLL